MSPDQAAKIIAEIWEDILDLEVRPDDNVFDLGAYSVLAVDVVARAKKAGLRFKTMDVFDHPTPAGLARHALAQSARLASDDRLPVLPEM